MKKICAAFCSLLLLASITGCDSSTANDEAKKAERNKQVLYSELRQNDYRGSVQRTLTLKNSILAVMEGMKANNTIVRQDSPNSYWTADGYQDFVSTFLTTSLITNTQWFNEEETSWESIITQMTSSIPAFTNSDGKLIVTVLRNEKDDYSITNVNQSQIFDYNGDYYSYEGKASYKILYDCDKDWAKAYVTLPLKECEGITTALFEYQRLTPDSFIIQTGNERLMIILQPVENDTSLIDRQIKEFYYSKLVSNGTRTTYKPYEPLPELANDKKTVIQANVRQNEKMATDYPITNGKGDLFNQYGVNDSMFFKAPKEITRDWVFEDKALQQGIVYKDGILIVTTYNKLSTYYERFIYSRSGVDTSGMKALEDLVQIENLVGVQSTEVKEPTQDNKGNTTSGEENSSTTSSENSSETTSGDTSSSTSSTESNTSTSSSTSSTSSESISTTSENNSSTVLSSDASTNSNASSVSGE